MKCKIVLRWTYRNHLDEFNDYKEEFDSLPNFRNYLRWEPDRAVQIGYGKAVYTNESRNTNVRLSLLCNGKEVEFKDASAFGAYVRYRPEIARDLQM